MAEMIEFYFDFSSPYGYLAAQRIDGIGARHGRTVAWKPFLLGVLFKATGSQPLVQIPLKGDYAKHDLARSARLLRVPFNLPDPFPFMSVAACRAYYWLAKSDRGMAHTLARAIYHEAFGEGRDMGSLRAVADVADSLGIDREALSAATQQPEIKERLRAEVDAAIAKGVFGSPYLIVDGEPFWGHDRLDQVDKWLATGGW